MHSLNLKRIGLSTLLCVFAFGGFSQQFDKLSHSAIYSGRAPQEALFDTNALGELFYTLHHVSSGKFSIYQRIRAGRVDEKFEISNPLHQGRLVAFYAFSNHFVLGFSNETFKGKWLIINKQGAIVDQIECYANSHISQEENVLISGKTAAHFLAYKLSENKATQLFNVSPGSVWVSNGNEILLSERHQISTFNSLRNRLKPLYKNLENNPSATTIIEDRVYSAIKKGNSYFLMRMADQKSFGNNYPSKGQFNPTPTLQTKNGLYFFSASNGQTALFFFDEKNQPELIRSDEIIIPQGLKNLEDNLFYTTGSSLNSRSLIQLNKKQAIPFKLDHIGSQLHTYDNKVFASIHDKGWFYVVEINPIESPKLETKNLILREHPTQGFKWNGVLTVENPGDDITYKMVSGPEGLSIDKNGVFELTSHPKKWKTHFQKVAIEVNNGYFSTEAIVGISYIQPQKISKHNLEEHIMFLPDFSRHGCLKAKAEYSDGTIAIYDGKTWLISYLNVENNYLCLDFLDGGIYYLNYTERGLNYYQKIEIK